MNKLEIPCPKFGCRGTLEPYATKTKRRTKKSVGMVITLLGCDECQHSEEQLNSFTSK